MGRAYTVVASNLTVTAARTLVFVRPTATRKLRILKVELSCAGTATSFTQRVQLVTQVTAFPTLTAATPQNPDATAFPTTIAGATDGSAGSAGINASVEGAGAKTVRYEASFLGPVGWAWVPGPDDPIDLPAAAAFGFGVYLADTPSTTTGWTCTVTFVEE